MARNSGKRNGSILGRLRNSVSKFLRDQRGSVTIQVMFFSLMVFGATGVVLDAGRVYDSHSQMQMYADHLALLAAKELDGKSDSISRATNSVFSAEGVAGALLLGKDASAGDYTIENVSFYSAMAESDSVQNDMSASFPAEFWISSSTDASTSADADESREATHVVVTVAANVNAVTQALTRTIVDIGKPHDASNIGGEQIGPKSYGLAAVSAATMERKSCAELSSLVMCNPWEDQDDSLNELLVDPEDSAYSIPGRSLMYFAPNFNRGDVPSNRIIENGEDHGSLFAWDVHHQLFQVDQPFSDPAGVCSDTFLRDLQGQVLSETASAEEYMGARDRCLMARAVSPEVCWSDDNPLTIRPANGDTVLRSINTIFDIWMPPFDTMIQDTTVIGEVVVPVGGGSETRSVTFADFVAPDILATSTYDTADRFGAEDPSMSPVCQDTTPGGNLDDERLIPDGIPDYNRSWPCDDPNTDDGDPNTTFDEENHPDNYILDAFQPAYDTIPKPGWSYVAGTRGEGIGYDYCHDKTLGRQDSARRELTLCYQESLAAADPVEAEAQCDAQYLLDTSFETCSLANPGRAREACGCAIDFVGDHHLGQRAFYMYARTLPHRGRFYSFNNGVNPNVALPVHPVFGPNSWYDYYKAEREMQRQYPSSDVTTQAGRSRVAVWNGDPDNNDMPDYVDRYNLPRDGDALSPHLELRAGYLKHYPDDFLALTGRTRSFDASFSAEGEFIDPYNRERRRIKSAMVNCGVVTGLMDDEDGTRRSANPDGTYDVTLDDMRVMDAYIPNPAGIFCGYNDVSCDIAGSVETSMYIELINDDTENATSEEFTVMLVR